MNTYLVTIIYGGNYDDMYVDATSAYEAVKAVRNTLDANARRWANVFVG